MLVFSGGMTAFEAGGDEEYVVMLCVGELVVSRASYIPKDMVCSPQTGLYVCMYVCMYVCVCVRMRKQVMFEKKGGFENARLDRNDRHLDCTRANLHPSFKSNFVLH